MQKRGSRAMVESGQGDEGDRKSLGALRPHQATTAVEESSTSVGPTLEEVLEASNLKDAWMQVKRNRGSAGVDRMTIAEAERWLEEHESVVTDRVRTETYRPAPVRRVDIPKPDGGTRTLGVPTVIDRWFQQAVARVLSRWFDPTFSESSYGFRPNRSAHQAVEAAKEYIAQGRRWVVDLDLEKFFDRVNHDVLMERLARRIADKRLLRLIRLWLSAGMMDADGVVHDRTEGTPQGGPLSPVLANVLLDELDKKLERAGHTFCRYADDVNVYVRSRRAGERVLAWMSHFLDSTLRLKVNEAKSAVDRPWKRTFLGFSFTSGKVPKIRMAKTSLQRMRERVRRITSRRRGVSVPRIIDELNRYLRGWFGYYRLAETPSVFRDLDGWIRRRLRCFVLKKWKKARAIRRNLRALGVAEGSLTRGYSSWWPMSRHKSINQALGQTWFKQQGLLTLTTATNA